MMKKTGMLTAMIFLLLTALFCQPVFAFSPANAERPPVISAGFQTSAAVTPDGTLYMWGSNGMGQMGSVSAGNGTDGKERYQTVPLKIMEEVSSVSCSYSETLVLKRDGTVWSMGSRTAPENLDDPSEVEPKMVLDNAAAVSTESDGFAVLRKDGSLWMWGNNVWGRYGNGTSGYSSKTPIQVMDHVAVYSAEGSDFLHTSAVVKTDGTLWGWGPCWGFDNYAVPVKIMDGVKDVSCGDYFAAVIRTDDSLWMIPAGEEALNECGQLGTGSVNNLTQPVKIMDNVRQVDVGMNFCAAVKKDGSLWTWGANDSGQLGNGMKGNGYLEWMENGIIQTSPVKVMEQVQSVSCGGSHMLVQKTDGTVWSCGSNVYGQIGNGRKGDRTIGGYFPSQSVPVKISLPIRQFSDVPFDAYYAEPVIWAVGRNITTGMSASSFGPDKSCSRAHAVTFLWRVAGSPEPKQQQEADPSGDVAIVTPELEEETAAPAVRQASAAGNPFADVHASDYYYKAVLWAVGQGITNGVSETAFAPDQACTRSQIVTFLWRYHGSPETTLNRVFRDVSDTAYYAKPVAWAVQNGITNGIEKDLFGPGQTCTRGQIVTFLYRDPADAFSYN